VPTGWEGETKARKIRPSAKKKQGGQIQAKCTQGEEKDGTGAPQTAKLRIFVEVGKRHLKRCGKAKQSFPAAEQIEIDAEEGELVVVGKALCSVVGSVFVLEKYRLQVQYSERGGTPTPEGGPTTGFVTVPQERTDKCRSGKKDDSR